MPLTCSDENQGSHFPSRGSRCLLGHLPRLRGPYPFVIKESIKVTDKERHGKSAGSGLCQKNGRLLGSIQSHHLPILQLVQEGACPLRHLRKHPHTGTADKNPWPVVTNPLCSCPLWRSGSFTTGLPGNWFPPGISPGAP